MNDDDGKFTVDPLFATRAHKPAIDNGDQNSSDTLTSTSTQQLILVVLLHHFVQRNAAQEFGVSFPNDRIHAPQLHQATLRHQAVQVRRHRQWRSGRAGRHHQGGLEALCGGRAVFWTSADSWKHWVVDYRRSIQLEEVFNRWQKNFEKKAFVCRTPCQAKLLTYYCMSVVLLLRVKEQGLASSFFYVCCANYNYLVRCQISTTSYSTGITITTEKNWT